MDAGNAEQRVDIGADVLDSKHEKVGTVAYVVVQPHVLRVTDIVVSSGAILGRDILVPLDEVRDVEGGRVVLAIDKDALQKCEDYVEVDYKVPPGGWAPTGFGYSPGAFLVPEGTYDPQIASVQVNAPPGTVGISKGMDVVSSDGHKVGSVDALEEDFSSGKVTAFLVKHGFLFTHDTTISVDDVAEVDIEKVSLRLSRDEVKRLEAQTS